MPIKECFALIVHPKHFEFDCEKERFNSHHFPTCPFISCYNDPNVKIKRKRLKRKRSSDINCEEIAADKPMGKEKTNSDQIDNVNVIKSPNKKKKKKKSISEKEKKSSKSSSKDIKIVREIEENNNSFNCLTLNEKQQDKAITETKIKRKKKHKKKSHIFSKNDLNPAQSKKKMMNSLDAFSDDRFQPSNYPPSHPYKKKSGSFKSSRGFKSKFKT